MVFIAGFRNVLSRLKSPKTRSVAIAQQVLERVNLGRHDKIVFMQAANFVGLEGHGAITPAKIDIRVMPLGLSKVSNPRTKRLSVNEVGKRKIALNPRCIRVKAPTRHTLHQTAGRIKIKPRHSALAWHAGLSGEGEIVCHCNLYIFEYAVIEML
jgi:hypothetical protein